MMKSSLQSIDLIVKNVPEAVLFFRNVVGLHVLQEFERFAELEGGGVRILLGPQITDWGTETVLIQGPEGIIIDLYRTI